MRVTFLHAARRSLRGLCACLPLLLIALATLAWPMLADANGHCKASGVTRDSHGHMKRSAQTKHEFEKRHPCPSTGKTSGACPGYVVDNVVPLKRGGADAPGNMQWQTTQAAKQKDKTE